VKVILKRTEYVILILAIFMLTGGLSGLYLKLFNLHPPAPVHFVHLPIMLLMLPVIVLRMRQTVFGLFSLLPFLALALLALASTKWSLDSAVTLRESLIFLFIGTYLVCAAWTYSWQELVEALWLTMFAMAVASLFLYIAVPNIGRMSDIFVGTLSGLWLEKNSAGQIGVFGASLALARIAIRPKTFLSSGISFLAFTLILLLSTSKTSLVAYVIAVGLVGWVFLLRRNMPVFIATLWGTIFGGAFIGNWIWYNKEVFFNLLGRNATFTGRAEIWKALEISISDRPLLGHGYSAYWNKDYMGTTLSYVLDDLKYYPSHSHNSWVEITLGLGSTGSYLMTSIIVMGVVFALWRVRSSHGAYYAIPFLASAVLVGSFEAVLSYPNNFGGAVLILVAAKSVRAPLVSEHGRSLGKIFATLGQYVLARQAPIRPQTPYLVHSVPSPVKPAPKPPTRPVVYADGKPSDIRSLLRRLTTSS
jgi:O-antigen ligase